MSETWQSSAADGQRRYVMTLPSHLVPTDDQRVFIERRADLIGKLLKQTPENSKQFAGKALVIITEYLMITETWEKNDGAIEVIGKHYLRALRDKPFWALDIAVDKWTRRDWGKDPDGNSFRYSHRPLHGDFFYVVHREVCRFTYYEARLRKLLAAEPYIQFSRSHCEAMSGRWSDLIGGVSSSKIF
jgi:hypothetical protein